MQQKMRPSQGNLACERNCAYSILRPTRAAASTKHF